MKKALETLSLITKQQVYLYTLVILCLLVPTVEILLGNIQSPFSSDSIAIYIGSIFALWVITALATRFLSIKSGIVVFLIFFIAWAFGAKMNKSERESQSSIAKSVAEIQTICHSHAYLKKNYCPNFEFNSDIAKTCNTDLVLLAPADMQSELRKVLNGPMVSEMLKDLRLQMDALILGESKIPNFSINDRCDGVDKITTTAYKNAITNINTQLSK